MNLEVRHLQMVQAIHEEGTVTKAATRLHVTQSALSHQLLGLEDRLGVPLFQRIGKQMLITPAGERVLSAGAIVLGELSRAEDDIMNANTRRDGIIRVSTECYTCYHWLPAHIRDFNREWPYVEVRIVVEATHQPHQALLDGKIDVGIVCSHWKNARLSYAPLFKDELVVITSPRHRLAKHAFVSAADFKGEHLIAYDVPRQRLTIFQEILNPAGVTPRAVSHVQLSEAIIEMVKGDLGIAALAYWAVAPHVQAGTLVAMPLTEDGLQRQWSAATVRSRSMPEYIKSFVARLRNDELLDVTGFTRSRRVRGRAGRSAAPPAAVRRRSRLA